MLLTAEMGEAEVKVTPLTRQVRFTNMGPGDLEISVSGKVTIIKNDSARILRPDGVVSIRTKTRCEIETKEIK